MQRLTFVSLLLVFCSHFSFSQTYSISGTVGDATTGERLPNTTIRVVGTSLGTIANTQGFFKLSLEHGEYTFAFSYIGYKSDTVRVLLNDNVTKHIALQQQPIQIPEVVVIAEYPAYGIIRKAAGEQLHYSEYETLGSVLTAGGLALILFYAITSRKNKMKQPDKE